MERSLDKGSLWIDLSGKQEGEKEMLESGKKLASYCCS